MNNTGDTDIRSESSYYDEICVNLQDNLAHALAPIGDYGVRFQKCGTKDMFWGLRRILKSLSHSDYEFSMREQMTQDLFVDIVGFVCKEKEPKANALVICEVKLNTLTLNDYAQLLGYCVTANAEHGLLMAVDHGISSRFDSNLRHNDGLKCVERPNLTHRFGILKWKSHSKEVQFNEVGYYRSWHILARTLARSIDKKHPS